LLTQKKRAYPEKTDDPATTGHDGTAVATPRQTYL
ncbi:unnamed protein product, partial [marine sediment metagenome]